MLGDSAVLAWTNLGLWYPNFSYVQACEHLADHLAQTLNLTSDDIVLDLGCGQGASLVFWQNHYQIKHIEAVELQHECVQKIKTQSLHALKALYCASFLNLTSLPLHKKFTAVVCIDALYHHALDDFLKQINWVLNLHGKFGFHYLVLSKKWQSSSYLVKQKYRYLLKVADIQIDHLMACTAIEEKLNLYGFEHIKIENLTGAVLHGFSQYINECHHLTGIAGLKIKATAQLCQMLYQDGLIDYVQITGIKKAHISMGF